MYELIRAGEGSWLMDCPSRVGFFAADGGLYLVDGGSDPSAAKKALHHVDALGLPLRAVLCTHSHADHIGGCRLLCERTGAPAYLPDGEVAFGRTPALEGALLFGAAAPAPLRGKFMLAPSFPALPLSDCSLPEGVQTCALPGHSPDGHAYRAPDGTWFVGDVVFGAETLDKYHLSYLYDAGAALASYEAAAALEGSAFVPSHAAAPVSDLAPLAARNRAALQQAIATVAQLCAPGLCFDELLKAVFACYGLEMSVPQYALIGSAVKAILTYLSDGGQVAPVIESGRVLWRVC